MESSLEGKDSGNKVKITVPPETGYGVRDASQVLVDGNHPLTIQSACGTTAEELEHGHVYE